MRKCKELRCWVSATGITGGPPLFMLARPKDGFPLYISAAGIFEREQLERPREQYSVNCIVHLVIP